MADVVVLLNPLDVSRRRRLHLGEDVPLLAWVDAHEPALGTITREVFVNGHACTDPAYRTHAHDEVLVAFAPGAPAVVGYYIVQALVSFAIGFVLSKLFAPHQPSAANTPSPSQVYGIAQPRNAARLGEPIPVIYGSVVALPDFAAQPFTRFIQNDMYFYGLLCLGQGEHQVSEMLLGQTSANVLSGDIVSWSVYSPAAHQSTFGVIEGIIDGFSENMVTSPAVADQELIASNLGGVLVYSTWYWQLTSFSTTASGPPPGIDLSNAGSQAAKLALLPQNPSLGTVVSVNFGFNGSTWSYGTYTATNYIKDQSVPSGSLIPPPTWSGAGITKWAGPFETCKAGQAGATLELDFVFPGGLYSGDASGNLTNRTVSVQVGYTPINAAGAATGAEVQYTETFTAKENTPQRFSMPHAVPSGRYRVRVSRATDSDLKVSTVDRVIWAGLKFRLDPPPVGTRVYGNVTLIAVRLKATNGVASEAAGSMRFRCTRRLPRLGVGAPVASANPADAFVDILTAPYGGARPVNADELDLDELASSRVQWLAHNGFNAIFDQPSTVWEALGLAVQTVHAAPLPVGSRMSLIHDGVQAVASQVFTDANIVAGSLQVTAHFDQTGTPAGVRVNYRDAQSFSPRALLDPPDAPDFITLNLFGCTSPDVAQEHATLAHAKRSLQRMSIEFASELEGLNVLPGDRIGVQASLVRWAQAARVASSEPVSLDVGAQVMLHLDRELTWTAGAMHAVQLRTETGAPVRVVGVTQGATASELLLPGPAPFPLMGFAAAQEPTQLAFGVVGQEITDWSVSKLTPSGDQVSIEAANYDPAIWAGAATFAREGLA